MRGGKHIILIVDCGRGDFRDSVVESFQEKGFKVIWSSDLAEAKYDMDQNRPYIDLIVCGDLEDGEDSDKIALLAHKLGFCNKQLVAAAGSKSDHKALLSYCNHDYASGESWPKGLAEFLKFVIDNGDI